MASARVPDLGSDFAQKLLQDLRRRRERLGFGSGSTQKQQQQQQQRATSSPAAASRDACSNSQNSVRTHKPRQAAAVAAQRTHQQQSSTSNAVASAGKPRHGRRDVAPVVAAADASAIVPLQGGGKTNHAVVAGNVDGHMAALALALSQGGKLQNIDMVARNGSVFLRQTDAARRGGGYLHAGEMAIGVQDLNDMLVAAYSSGGGRRRPDEESRNRFFRGSMDMEEALSMLVTLQDASGYMEGSGGGNALLLKGRESRESSARIEEIVDEDSDDAEHAKNASTQIVVHNEFQSHQSSSKISNASEGGKDGSKVRMPSVIAKLMGLENLPSTTTTTKSVAERKGTEKFVRPGAVSRMEARGSASMDRKLPIRIVASEKGHHKIVLEGEWKNGLTEFGDSEIGATALSNSSSSHPATGNNNRQGRLTMREVLRRMVAAERGADESQVGDERIIHEDKRIAEEIKMQSSVRVGCRADSGKKMDFLKRFRKNSDNRPVKEEKNTAQEKNATAAGKKQATGMRRLLGREGEAKSRREREKLNKENLATAQTKGAGKNNGKADQIKRQAQSEHIDIQSKPRKPPQNCRATQSETSSRNLEKKKKPLMSEAGHVKKEPECNVVTQQGNEEHVKMNDTISSSKPADSARAEEGLSETLAMVVRSSITAGAVSLDQPLLKITEGTSDPTISAQTVVVQASEDLKLLDQSAIAEIDDERIDHTPSETTQVPETFAQEEEEEQQMRISHTPSEAVQILETLAAEERQQQHQQQQQQQMIVKEQLTNGSDHQTTTTNNSTDPPDHKTHVVSCDSFTEKQLLLMKLLVKDRYLLETAKAIVRVDAPVSFTDDDDTARNWSDKGNGLLSDVAREVIRRKCKRSEAVEQVSIARTANLKLRYLDDLVRELDGDVESLDMCSRKPHRQGDNGAAEGLQMILRSDIRNEHPDANSTWDFGWNRIGDLPIEKGEVVRDLEKNILGGIITDVARDLIGASVRHGCCPCVA